MPLRDAALTSINCTLIAYTHYNVSATLMARDMITFVVREVNIRNYCDCRKWREVHYILNSWNFQYTAGAIQMECSIALVI